MAQEPQYKLDTLALHAGHQVDSDTLSRAVPIYQTTSYLFKDTDHAANLFALKEFGNIYTRLMNPTTDVFEKRLAALDGGVGALAFSSGQSAIYTSIFNICGAGGHIVSSSSLYGGTVTLFSRTFPKLGIDVTFVDPKDPGNFAKAIKDNTRLIYIETLGNPKNDVLEYEKIAEIAHKNGMPVICDNTVMTPILFRPIDNCGLGPIRLDQRKIPRAHRARPQLPRRKIRRGRWRPCLYHKGANAVPPRYGLVHVAVQRLSIHPGPRNPAPAYAKAQRKRPGPGAVARKAAPGLLG